MSRIIRLNRPQVRNALSVELLLALTGALERLDADDGVHVIVLTGGDRFFAAGADIAAMAGASAAEMAARPQLGCWQRMRQIRKPLIAAVNGFALGGGAELVWVCDLVVAGESARFGQPEIALGIMPGGGGHPTSAANDRQNPGVGNRASGRADRRLGRARGRPRQSRSSQ